MGYTVLLGYSTKNGFRKQSELKIADNDLNIDAAVAEMEVKFEDWMSRNPSRAKRRTAIMMFAGFIIKIKHCDFE